MSAAIARNRGLSIARGMFGSVATTSSSLASTPSSQSPSPVVNHSPWSYDQTASAALVSYSHCGSSPTQRSQRPTSAACRSVFWPRRVWRSSSASIAFGRWSDPCASRGVALDGIGNSAQPVMAAGIVTSTRSLTGASSSRPSSPTMTSFTSTWLPCSLPGTLTQYCRPSSASARNAPAPEDCARSRGARTLVVAVGGVRFDSRPRHQEMSSGVAMARHYRAGSQAMSRRDDAPRHLCPAEGAMK